MQSHKRVVVNTNNSDWCKVGLDVLGTERFMDRLPHQGLFKKYTCSGVKEEFCHRWVVG